MSDIEDRFYCDLLEKHPINSKISHNGKSMFVVGCEPVEDRKIVYLSSNPNDDFPLKPLTEVNDYEYASKTRKICGVRSKQDA